MNYQVIDLPNWPRYQHFEFYRNAAQPWFNICADVDVSELYRYCQAQQLSFFHAYLFLTQVAVNQHPAFQLRIVKRELRCYQEIAISCAVLGDDQLMRFCDLPFADSFSDFTRLAQSKVAQAKEQPFIAKEFCGQAIKQDVVHMSVIPWLNFRSFSNARHSFIGDSIPKIVYGKLVESKDGYSMPLSVEVHHGMMDGLAVGQFFSTIEELFSQPQLWLTRSS
ncbi:CatA-like O-acetyltransferase [Psychrobium sp. 1_MG-2023]|uniref:CatA-like O-acetyltransferase n=1 Tax=Psychrobium sp. 1_MG-2023 TaxID=3062624 RepID=UPI0026BB9D38|nr:CatA-like O-acetyltransferase [Psychrobium sp. 1_MG-2023]MDP2562049.1 CatA-like O-acetyltransferase [Psychrobium sp. 1_MG-2023]